MTWNPSGRHRQGRESTCSIFIQQGWAFLKPWFWANLWPCELLGFGIPCLTFADLWSLQGQSSCKFWLWPCPCSWRFNISYAMLTGDPFPIVLMHSPILGLCVDSLVRVPFQNYCQSHCQLGKFFCTANCRSFGNPAGSGPTCLTWFWMACCWTEERSPVRLSWRPGNLVNVAEFHMLTLQLCDWIRRQFPLGPAEAIFLALPYLVLVAVFLQQLVCRKQRRKRPQPTKILYVPGQQHDLASLGDCSLSYSGVKNRPWSCAIQINLTFSDLCNPRSDILGCAELTTPSRWRFCKVSPSWCKPLEKSPCWGASSPLPKKSRTRLPFFGLVLASGLSLLCCVGTVSIPPFFLCSLTLPGLELEQHLRMLLWTLATSWPTWVWHLGLNLVWQVSRESSFRSWWFDSQMSFNGKRHCCKVLVAMLRLRTASEGWGNFGEDLTLQFRN